MNKPSILLVEDEAIVAADLAGKVRQMGYKIVGTTSTGEEAVTIAAEQNPALVLMDIKLAGKMDGIEAAEIIHRENRIPTIFLTAHSDQATVERAQKVEESGYILKPFQARDLHIQIELALHKHAADKLLRDSEERFRSLAEISSDWIWEIGLDDLYIYVSPKVRDLLGYEPEELIYCKSPFDLMPPEEAEKVRSEHNAAKATHQPLMNIVNVNLHKDGHIVVLETNAVPIFDSNGKFSGYRGIDRDITRRGIMVEELQRQKEELELKFMERTADLQKSEKRCRNYVDYAPYAIFEHDENGKFVDVNPAARRITGYSEAELLNLRVPDLLAPESQALGLATFTELQKTGYVSVEYEFVTRSGEHRWAHGVAVKLSGTRFLGFYSDITESRRVRRPS